jgi:hypothetical protein
MLSRPFSHAACGVNCTDITSWLQNAIPETDNKNKIHFRGQYLLNRFGKVKRSARLGFF